MKHAAAAAAAEIAGRAAAEPCRGFRHQIVGIKAVQGCRIEGRVARLLGNFGDSGLFGCRIGLSSVSSSRVPCRWGKGVVPLEAPYILRAIILDP